MLALGTALLLAPSPARAAHWAVTYECSGATTDRDGTVHPWTSPAPPGSDGFVSENSNPYRGQDCAGTLTPVLTWTKDSGETTLPPAPAKVSALLTVSCTATAQGGTESAADGYGDSFPQTTPDTVSGSFIHLEQKDNTALAATVRLPGVSVTLHATATGFSNSSVSAKLKTQITTLSLTINLTGTKKDSGGTDNILVGQGCSAGVTATGGTVSAPYSWTVSGNKFKSWTASSSSATLDSGVWPNTSAMPHWFWSDTMGPKTVTCTATVTPTGQSAMQVTVSKTVNLQVPSDTLTASPGRVQINTHDPGRTGYYLFAGDNGFSGRGFDLSGTVTTPTGFQGSGGWDIVQITHPARWRTTLAGVVQPWSLNGQNGLDTQYPYDPVSVSNPFPANGTFEDSGDTPGLPVVNTYKGYQVAESFNTYILYQPPGSDVAWVPLKSVDWKWDANVTIPSGGWSLWPDSPTNTTAGSVTIKPLAIQTIHPVWQHLITAPTTPDGW